MNPASDEDIYEDKDDDDDYWSLVSTLGFPVVYRYTGNAGMPVKKKKKKKIAKIKVWKKKKIPKNQK